MLDSLFKPKSVAVIGASGKELSIGNRIIKNLIDFGFKGEIYPINPKADQIRGIKAYKSILDVPAEGIDVVHMVIPAKFVALAVEDCGVKGVKNVIINSGGFSEIGPKGFFYEEDMLARAEKHGIRVLGPNCQGIINTDPDIKAYCNFTFTMPEPGFISMVALSGGVAELIHQRFSEMGVGTRIYASNGNACDITIPDIINYLGDDDPTKVIVTYVEGLRDPENFMKTAREVAAKKPILAMKAGRTKEGAKAAASHTGGLAKEDLATDLIFKKAGILSFTDEGELCDAAAVFATQPIPKGNRVALITNTGGPAVIATDVLVDAGLEIPPLSEKAKAALKESLYKAASVNNPIDVLATANAAHFRTCLDVLMEEENIDAIFINLVTPFFVDNESIVREIVAVNKSRKKPIICNLMTDQRQWTEVVKILRDGEVPFFSLPSAAARAMTSLVKYHETRKRDIGQPTIFNDVDKAKVDAVFERVKIEGRQNLSAAEVYSILEAYKLPVAKWKVVDKAEEVAPAAAEIGFPVVLKVDSDSVLHKSDLGGVAVNLADEAAVSQAALEMAEKFKAHNPKFFIQQFLPGGKEIIIGAKAEEGLGHMIMFGLGGVYVEIMKDVVFNLTPVTPLESSEMLDEIKGAKLLRGARGEKGADLTAIAEAIQRLSQLTVDYPLIEEMDLNPIMAFENQIAVVDARLSVKPSKDQS